MDIEIIQVLGPWSALIVVGLVAAYVWERTHRPLKVELRVTLKGDEMGISIIPPPVEAPWRLRRWAKERAMAPTKVPPDVGTLFENYLDFVITDTGRYIFAAMTKEHGIVVFDTKETIYAVPQGDWGAPALSWRPDGQLIVCSVSQGGEMIQIDSVPGVKRSG